MKVKFILSAVMAAAVLMAASCSKDNNPQPGPKPDEKSSACKLTSLIVTSGPNSRECTVYEKDKLVEVFELPGYDLEEMYLLPFVSEGATTDVDPEKAYDLSELDENPVTITVTAEDGVHTARYSISVRVPEVEFEVNPLWEKTAGAVGLIDTPTAGGAVAFAGPDKFVIFGGKVCDVETGTPTGDVLCEDGIEEGMKMFNLANDENGVVVANYILSGEGEAVLYGATFAWLDGISEAPTVIYSNKASYEENPETGGGNAFGYMSCGGDIFGDFILTAITAGRGATTMHHCFEFHNADFENPTWHAFNTDYVSNDGNWGQMVSPTSGDVAGWFVIGDSMGSNKGYHVYTRAGVENLGMDFELWGTTWPDGLIPDGYGDDPDQRFYGNYSTGHVRGFQFKGIDYVIATTTGWPCTYLTIQSMFPDDPEDIESESGHYMLRTQQLEGSQVRPSSSYILDEVNERGLVITCSGSNFYLYEIVGDLL